MFPILLLFSCLSYCCCFNVVYTPRSQWTPQESLDGNITSNAQQYSYIPEDNGGNFGDLIHLRRQHYDVLLTRETVINSAFNQDTILELEGLYGSSITSVWSLNFGRQRGFVEQVTTQGNRVYVRIVIRARFEIRLLVDVYGFAWIK